MKPSSSPQPVPIARNKSDGVYTAIYDAVMEHRLQPGTKLTESTFSDFFGVSRSVVRKALFRLAQKNIVELRPNRGAIVARPTVAETRDVFSARRVVEAAVVAGVIGASPGREQFQPLRRHLREEELAYERRDRRTSVRLSGEFHILLAGMQPNRVLRDYVGDLVSRTTLIIALYEAPGSPGCRVQDHAQLLECLEENDAAAATRAMHRHLTEIESNLNLEETERDIDLNEVFGRR